MKLEELLPARTVKSGEITIQPVAKLRGWCTEQEAGGRGLIRLSPASITVEHGETSYNLPIPDPTAEALRALLKTGAIVSGLCLLVMLLATLFTRR